MVCSLYFHQDFVASMHNDFFKKQTDWSLIYRPYTSEETSVEEEVEALLDVPLLQVMKQLTIKPILLLFLLVLLCVCV
jgi:hypothetical protein